MLAIPSRLDSFAERVEGVHGSAEQIARKRTLLKFYAPFHRPCTVEDAIASIRSTSVAHLKYRLGIVTSRFDFRARISSALMELRSQNTSHDMRIARHILNEDGSAIKV